MGKVLIKCIQTPMQKYFYDRSLDSVVMVNDEEYQILKTVEKTKLVPDGVLRRFVKSGLLRETAIEEILAGESKNVEFKENLPEKSIKYMKSVVAFANGTGVYWWRS